MAYGAIQQLLDSLLSEALTQPVHISTDVQEEARENLFYFGLSEAELPLASSSALEAWLQAVVASKRQQLQQQGDHYPMQFYCWHDAQATQLRFSLVSAVAPLPFSCALQLVELPDVVREFLTQEYLLFDQNIFNPDSAAGRLATAQATGSEFTLSVWCTVIP